MWFPVQAAGAKNKQEITLKDKNSLKTYCMRDTLIDIFSTAACQSKIHTQHTDIPGATCRGTKKKLRAKFSPSSFLIPHPRWSALTTKTLGL